MNWTATLATRSTRSRALEDQDFLTLPPQIGAALLLAAALQTRRVTCVPGHACFADAVNGTRLRLCFFGADEKAMIDPGTPRHGRATRRRL